MDLQDFVSHKQARDEALEAVAAKIRPLPQEVGPSDGFRLEMRLRLLNLEPGRRNSVRQAA